MCDVVWSDPFENEILETNFEQNDRGQGFKFGLNPVKQALKNTGTKVIVRAHEVMLEGYKYHNWD